MHFNLENELVLVKRGDQIINDFKVGFPIDGGNEGKIIKSKRRIKAQELAKLDQLRRRNGKVELVAARLALDLGDFLKTCELGLDRREKLGGRHTADSAFFLAAASML